jgi:mono/diheme cytochrome c family protein
MKLPLLKLFLALIALFGAHVSAYATPDVVNGKKIDQQKCYTCHAKKSGFGNGDMIYTRGDSKVKNLQNLKSLVAMCNTELRLDLFPEDEADVAAFLNKQFYKFK